MKGLTNVVSLLTNRERIYLWLLAGVTVLQAGFEMASVGSIAPFLMVAANPSKIQELGPLKWAYETFEFPNPGAFLVFLAAASLAVLIVTNLFSGLTLWAQQRFTQGRIYSFSARLLGHYVNQPYSYFLSRHSADMGRSILLEAQQSVNLALNPMVMLFSQGASALGILGLLMFVDAPIALAAAAVLGLSYVVIYWGARRRLLRLGREHVNANLGRFKSASDVFDGIKEVKAMGKEQAMVGLFREHAAKTARLEIASALTRGLPKLGMDVVAIGSILGICVYLLVAREGGVTEALPTLGMLAFAGFRLMPKLQGVFHAMAQIRYGSPIVEHLAQEFSGAGGIPDLQNCQNEGSQLRLVSEIALQNVSYTYPNADRPTLQNVSLVVEANSIVGLIGTTGSGKTTLGDVILGLLTPQQGEVRVDGKVLDSRMLRNWMLGIGYVPQHVFLIDDTVARNIAFGVPVQNIDYQRVSWAATVAQVHDFITSELPHGYETRVGERGTRLSGGQRQRIGIARALYRNPQVLLLDEATSALDSATESAVTGAIERLTGTRTIIIIAHRVSTLTACSRIFELEQGRVVRAGSYEEVLGSKTQGTVTFSAG